MSPIISNSMFYFALWTFSFSVSLFLCQHSLVSSLSVPFPSFLNLSLRRELTMLADLNRKALLIFTSAFFCASRISRFIAFLYDPW